MFRRRTCSSCMRRSSAGEEAGSGRCTVTIRAVPEISRFLGIVIVINYNEHDPPHFHARYGRQKVSVRIADGLVTGSFPARALAHVLEWWNLHQSELAEDWQLASHHWSRRSCCSISSKLSICGTS